MPPIHSLVIPVYNAAPFLPQCLDSITNQKVRDWECICVDDGSTDESSAILDAYARKDNRFRVVHTENRGPGAARNTGIELARGEWVSFVDSDDFIHPDYLAAFDALPVKADMVFFQLTTVDGTGVRRNVTFPSDLPTEPLSEERDVFQLICRFIYNERHADMFGWTCNKFLRRSLLQSETVRFDTTLQCYEDELFAMAVFARAKTVAILPRCLYFYRLREGSLTSQRESNKAELADAYNQALKGFSNPEFLSLQCGRLFHLFKEAFYEDPTPHNLDRLLSFFQQRRKHLRFDSRGKRLRMELAASPLFHPIRKFPHAIRSFLGEKTICLWTPDGETKPAEISTFFV